MPLYLTKSDFKACADCRTRLYYRKNRYPTSNDDNPFLQLLADGGFMVEFVAKAQYPGGIDLADERDPATAYAKSRELLAHEGAVVFEAAAISGSYYVRTDILLRRGDSLDLIEVKSSSLDGDAAAEPFRNARGGIIPKWREYLLDLAFQTMVVRAAFPGLRVNPSLCVINKAHRVAAHETISRFTVSRDETNSRSRSVVHYAGDPSALKGTQVLVRRDATAEVEELIPEVKRKAEELATLLEPTGVRRVQEGIADHYRICRTCEYRVAPEEKPNGFGECWGALANVQPHILEMHRVGQIARKDEPDPVATLLKRGRASLCDLEAQDLAGDGARAERRLIQWRHSKDAGSEYLPDELRSELTAHRNTPGYPLHFMDFEACDISLPPHAGLKPYERVAFQWSCHTLYSDGRLTQAEWLDTGRTIPNFVFARTLRETLGETGTVYVWSAYEQTTLRKVMEQIGEWLARDPAGAVAAARVADEAALRDLASWIDRLLGPEDADGKRHSPRIVDLHEIALRHYFHPRMGGRTSIKVVLPAVWESNAALRAHPWFSEYNQSGANGRPIDPYKTLPPLPLGDEATDDVVKDGTGAIRVYQDLIFRSDHDKFVRNNRRNLLLQYCKLDTAAMVMIWMHWTK